MARLTLCSDNTMKPLLWFAALSLIVLSIVWISGAARAGLFIRDAQGIASPIDENGIELLEIVSDGTGGWVERERTVNLGGSAQS